MYRIKSLLLVAFLIIAASIPLNAQKRLSGQLQMPVLQNSTEFDSLNAFSDGEGVWIRWQMKTEQNNLGFNVYRISDGKSEVANPNFIPGGYMRSAEESVVGELYSFYDPHGGIGTAYVIETLAINGGKITSERIFTQYIQDLFKVAGKTSIELKNESKKAENRLERNQLLLSKELQTEIEENSLAPDLSGQRFVASQPGVKLGTKREGIYRVTRAELQNAGFNVSLPSENWQLFMNGNEQSITIGNAGDYVEFYGKGIDTVEADTQIYYLINGSQPGKRINDGFRRRIGGTVVDNSYSQSFYMPTRLFYISSIRNGEASNFFNHVVNTTGANINFHLDGIDQAIGEATFSVGVQGLTTTPHNVNVSLNGTALTALSGNNYDLMTRTYQIPTSLLVEGTNTVNFRVPSSSSDVNLVESIRVNYARVYKAQQNTLAFFAKSNKQFEIKDFSSSQIRVFDTTFPDSPSIITNLQQTSANGMFGRIIPANRTKRMFATTDDAVRSVDSIELNTPSSLSTTNHNANLIIVAYKDWLSEAQAWANYRIGDGMSVEIVRIDDIFDEFNYGMTSANSMRAFFQFAKNNWNTPPNYVLLLGDASYDPRGYTGHPNVNFVPTKLFDTQYEETGSDEALVDFNDDGLAELSIGRIPVKLNGEATNALTRTMVFEQTREQAFSRGAIFASDLPNGYDFAGMNQRLANELPAGTNKIMINRGDVNGRANLLAELSNGRFLINYAGHGAPRLWAATAFYSATDVDAMMNGTNYSIFTLLTCLNGYFIAPEYDSIAELFLKAPNGGAVAAWASSGKTTPDVQEILARRFYQKISGGTIPRMGDLVRDAKLGVISGRDVRLSWTLLGDPTLKAR